MLQDALQHYAAGRLPQAEALCRRILEGAPASADAWRLLGRIAHAVGKPDAAVACLSQAAAFAPHAAVLWVELSQADPRAEAAERAAGHLRRAVALDPGRSGGWYALLGSRLLECGRTAAAAAFARAAALEPGVAEHHRRLALAEQWRGRPGAARRAFRRAFDASVGEDGVDADGAMLLREALAIPAVPSSVAAIAGDRRRFLEIMAEIRARRPRCADPLGQVGVTPFLLAYHATGNRALQAALAEACLTLCPALAETAPHCRPGAEPVPRPDGRIHLGIVSEHLHGHTIGQLNIGLVEWLPRDRFHLTLFLPPRPEDRFRARFTAAADRVVELPFDLAAARRAIAAERLDAIHYPDIGMTPLTYFLAFARLAPFQCLGWGHPDTTGIPNLDAFLSCDAMEPDGAEAHYTETLVRLPGPPPCYERPAPAAKRREALGLPAGAHLYVCPQSAFKFHPDFDPVLAAILRRDPEGLLVLVDPHGHVPALLERLAAGAPDVIGRVRVLPGLGTADFVALMAAADAMLDPLHYSGGNTSLEALAQGTPIVTWPGAFMRGRHTHGFYRLMGLHDLVARDLNHYVELAVRLGTDSGFRAAMRGRVLEACGVLYGNPAAADAMAEILASAVHQPAGTPAGMPVQR